MMTSIASKAGPPGARSEKSSVGSNSGSSPRESLKDRAYRLIKQKIVTLVYQPGSFLNEAQVSADLGIGRSPVHMAISRLALEDLVMVAPRKGVIVKPLTADEYRTVFEARLVNEPAAARFAALRASEADIDRLREIVRSSRSASKGDFNKMVAIDREFHEAIADASGNNILAQLMRTLHDRSLRQTYISWNYRSGLQSDTIGEHKAVVDAIADHDQDAAERAMRVHLESSARSFELMFPKALGSVPSVERIPDAIDA